MIKKLEAIFRKWFPKRMDNYQYFLTALKGKKGLEIGGPSFIFTSSGFLPIYDQIATLDGCNFSSQTIWEGSIQPGRTYRYGKHLGEQFISDGSDLSAIPGSKYDFVLSSHSLEHIANPIKALLEWKRVIRDGGYILLVVPHKDHTFDNKRKVTALAHLIEDYQLETTEKDSTHFEEVISLHDLSKDAHVPDTTYLTQRTKDNFANRSVHHHVFNTPLVAELADHLHLDILDIQHFNPFNIIALLQKHEGKIPDNSAYLESDHPAYQKDRYPSDKLR